MVHRLLSFAGTLVCALAVTLIPSAAADSGQSVRTQSGKMRCYVFANDVGHGGGPRVACQQRTAAPFPQAPVSSEYGTQMNIATVGADGRLGWVIGNIAGSREAMAGDVVMNYGQTYRMNGWTVLPSFEGTRFTNDATGHGMFVSIDNVYGF